MKTGLFFGSFNPIHIGHLIIANHIVEYTDLDKVWLMVTPHNPFKTKKSLLADHHRLAMVRIAVEDYPKLHASDFEFHLPSPHYTSHTLAHLSEKYPEHRFSLIMGEDNLNHFHKWKNAGYIIDNYLIYVYPRLNRGEPAGEFAFHPNIRKIDAPVMEISASAIRKGIKEKKNIRPLLPEKVWKYLDEMNFYK